MKNRSFFPTIEEIPKGFLLKSPVAQEEYLMGGELRRWNGPFREVVSPLYHRAGSGLIPTAIGYSPLLTEDEALCALKAAREAFDNGRGPWPSAPVEERIASFQGFTSAMKKKRQEVARLLMWEIGKPYDDALKEFDRTITYIHDTIRVLRRGERDAARFVSHNDITGRTIRVPIGVALCLGPFNYPLYETFTAVAPALLAGNTVVVKPPRYGALLFGPLLNLFRDYFPQGAVNIIYGDGKTIIPPLMSSGMIDVLAFIGTSDVANYLKRLHPRPHRLRSLLGLEAKNPAIILGDADLHRTVKESAMGALAFNGQRCAALKIFFVHRSVVDDFLKGFTDEVARLKCGMPWVKDVFITPLTEPGKAAYLTDLVEDAVNLGAGVVNTNGGNTEGSFFYPAILYPVNDRMRIFHEEQFGPVIPVVPYDDIDEPLRYIVQSPYGQQASLFGKNHARIKSLVDVLVHHVSRVNINCKCQRTPDAFPFTGRKNSAEGVLSVADALHAFSVPAVIAARQGEEKELLTHTV